MASVSIVVGLGIFILFLNFFFPHSLSPIVTKIARPFQITENATYEKLGGVLGFFKTHWTLEQENRNLRADLAYMNSIETEMNYYKSQKEELEKILGKISDPKQYVLARILAKPGFSPYDTLVIDSGSKDGVIAGAYVYADGTVLLGHVSSVNNRSAVVKLYSSPEERTNVFVGISGIESVAIGKGGGTFELKLPKNTDVKEGDIVTMASTTGNILGEIMHITNSASDAYEKALFKSPIDVSKITSVLVEK